MLDCQSSRRHSCNISRRVDSFTVSILQLQLAHREGCPRRNARLMLSSSSTCHGTWRRRRRTDMASTPSSYTGNVSWPPGTPPTSPERLSGCQASSVAIHLCRLPVPRPGQVLGLVGTNGIGKSTALKILAGKLKPNLGRLDVSDVLAAQHPKGCSIVLAVCLCWLLHACHEAALKAAAGLQ